MDIRLKFYVNIFNLKNQAWNFLFIGNWEKREFESMDFLFHLLISNEDLRKTYQSGLKYVESNINIIGLYNTKS